MSETADSSKSKISFNRLLGRLGKKGKQEPSSNSSAIITSGHSSSLHSYPPTSIVPFPVQAIDEAPGASEPVRIDRIALPSLLTHLSSNPAIVKVQEELQIATEELEAELVKYAAKFSEYAPLKDDKVRDAIKSAGEDGTGFGRMIEQVLSDQEIKNGTVSGKVGAFMGQLYPIAGIVLGFVSLGGEATGILPLKITANALNAVVSAASKENNRLKDVISSLPDLKKYDSFFCNLQKLGYDRVSEGLLGAATKLFVAITIFLRVSLHFLDSNRVVGAAKALTTDPLAEAKSGLSSAATDLDIAVNQEIFFDEKIRTWRKECERAMQFLSDLPVLKAHDDVRNFRVKKSGTWILQDETYLKWMKGEVKVVWCPGKPGAGKTFLCSTVIDRCRSSYTSTSDDHQAIGIAWMYCSYTNQSAQTIDKIIASLIKQLVASSSPDLGKELMKLVTKFQGDHKGGSPSLKDHLDLLSQVVCSLDRSVIIIDALDECAEVDSNGCNRELLIRQLTKLGVQLLVTSRNLPIIKALFNDVSSFGKIEISPDPDDIESYIHWRIYDEAYGSPKLRKLIEKHDSLLPEIKSVVKEKYSQIFNLARLQMDQIIKIIVYGKAKEALKVLPMKEGDFYDLSIKRIKAREDHAEQALRILAWIIRAKYPMKVEDMRYAAAIVPGDYSMKVDDFAFSAEDLVDCCEGLVIILPESGTMNLAHPTVNDYLESARSRIFPEDPEVIVASSCITYLASDDIVFSPDHWRKPLWSYAEVIWLEHTRGRCEEDVVGLIVELLKRNLKLFFYKGEQDLRRYMCREARILELNSLPLYKNDFWIACSKGLANTVQTLIETGSISSGKKDLDTKLAAFALEIAVRNSFLAVVKVLLKSGVSPNITFINRYGKNQIFLALHMAAKHLVPIEMVEFLLDAGADIEALDKWERTPLHLAASYHECDLAACLLKKGAKADAKDAEGATPLHACLTQDGSVSSWGSTVAIVSLLLDWGADANAKNKLGQSVLHLATSHLNDFGEGPEVLALLHERSAGVEVRNHAGQTPLNFATTGVVARTYNSSILQNLRHLLGMNANLETMDNQGRTPLHNSVWNYELDTVWFLLENGADINAEDMKGYIPIDLARARRKNFVDCAVVVDHNADASEVLDAELERQDHLDQLDKIIELLANAAEKACVR